MKSSISGMSALILTLSIATLFNLGCGQDKKKSSPPPPPAPAPAPAPTTPQPPPPPQAVCTPGIATCQPPQGNIGVPPQTVPQTPYQYGAGTCPAGQLYTYYGCLPTAGCPANFAMYNNNHCVPNMMINPNGMPQGTAYQNGSWGYYYSYPYTSGGYYPYYYTGYPYTNLGIGFSAWVR